MRVENIVREKTVTCICHRIKLSVIKNRKYKNRSYIFVIYIFLRDIVLVIMEIKD